MEDEFSVKLLYRALAKQKQEVILERMEYKDFELSSAADTHGKFYAAEFRVPFFSTDLQEQPPEAEENTIYTEDKTLRSFHTSDRVLYPGDYGWIYFKLYTNETQAQVLLAQYLEPFLANLFEQKIIKSFFFTRHTDPKYHIRLRLQIAESDKMGAVMQKFREWFGVLQENLLSYEYVITPYERELERYGGADLIDGVEEYFCYDSRLVIALLQEIGKNADEMDKEKICIWVMNNLVNCFYNSARAYNDFWIKYTNNFEYKDWFRKNKNEYLPIIEENYIENFSDKIQKIAAERTAIIRQYAKKVRLAEANNRLTNSLDNILLTLIHMFCNRYNGNPEWEHKALFLTRHTVQTKNDILRYNNKINKKERQELNGVG